MPDAAWTAHPDGCSCAVPCRNCGHESEQHAGSMWFGTGSRRCRVTHCPCLGCYIGSTPARCKVNDHAPLPVANDDSSLVRKTT